MKLPRKAAVVLAAVPLVLAGLTTSAQATEIRGTLNLKDSGAHVAQLQNRLSWLGYTIDAKELKQRVFGESTANAVRKVQTKFFQGTTGRVSPRTWDFIAGISGPIGQLPKECTEVDVSICIDKTQKLLRYVKNGKVVMTLDARFGLPSEPTREGLFSVESMDREHVSSAYDTDMPLAMFFSGNQAIHYSKYFKMDGYYGASHGCVNIRDHEALKTIFNEVTPGTRVYVYRSRVAK